MIDNSLKFFWAVMLLTAAAAGLAGGQTPPKSPGQGPAVKGVPSPTAIPAPPRAAAGPSQYGRFESAIATDPSVSVSLCVTRGKLNVNSWDRNELRVYVNGGNNFEFTVKEKNPKSGKPAWVAINAAIPPAAQALMPGYCLSAESIDIDAPRGTTLNVKGRTVTLVVDTVRRVNMSTVGGGTQLRNISGGITASVNEGNVSVEDSSGAISLETTTGNILVYESAPSEVGDTFRAKTNSGNIALQRIDHRQVEVNTISGSVGYNGAILSGGAYTFATQNGALRLTLPGDTKCQIAATYGGNFVVDLPLNAMTENISEGPVKTIVGTLGSGSSDATVKLTTPSGSIVIRKQQ